MAHVLFAVANATGVSAKLTSTEHPGDDGPIQVGVTHTGGSDDNWIFLPDCSDSNYWADHHITIAADDHSWAVSFWVNDQDSRQFYWSDTNAYSQANPVPASQNVDDTALMITINNGRPVVTWTAWT
jgi:hypothetical protein